MEIQKQVMKYKYHLLFTIIFCGLFVTLICVAPSFLTVLAYFWPLFVSTGLFLGTVVFFGKTSLPGTESSVDKAGEGILDYVAGQPEQEVVETVETFNSE